jgi:hypothetical protein
MSSKLVNETSGKKFNQTIEKCQINNLATLTDRKRRREEAGRAIAAATVQPFFLT